MEVETIYGIITIDLNTLSLNELSGIISRLSVDAGTAEGAKTVLYSGEINGYKTNNIAKSLDNVRIIDNTFAGQFLADDSKSSQINQLIESAIRNDITNGTFDIASVEKGLYTDQLADLSKYLKNIDTLTPDKLDEAVRIAMEGYKYEPTKHDKRMSIQVAQQITSLTSKYAENL